MTNRNEELQVQREFQNALKENASPPSTPQGTPSTVHPAIGAAIGGFVVLNVGLLLSLPPVLMGRGAPYLPTYKPKMDQMFAQLRTHFYPAHAQSTASIASNVPVARMSSDCDRRLTFVDLGSGDGRVVFRAAREGLFHKSIGYEINPFLHIVAQTRRFIQAPMYFSNTQFSLMNLWDVDLSHANVIAVYGLHPIMKDLGVKFQNELQPGSVVLSNVFAIPGWTPSSMSRNGLHVYLVPECWDKLASPTKLSAEIENR